jgi:TonB family protein
MAIKIVMAMRDNSVVIPFLSSCIVHIAVLVLGSALTQRPNLARREFFPISLVEVPPAPTQTTAPREEPPPVVKKPPPQKLEKAKESRRTPKSEALRREQPIPPATPKEEPSKAAEAKFSIPPKLESLPSLSLSAPVEGGGSEAGAGNLSDQGNAGVVPGNGASAGTGGSAASGLGRGSGPPGLPQTVVKTNRAAKPVQTVRAAYPPMALRAGLESDVTLRIEVDPQGNVTKAEIAKSGGAGFDEEALQAVKQSRFEPAQRDGHNVPAEFTYIYRFRLQK